MSKQTTGEFMATLRKANGYTQQEVAEKLNISNRTLSSWETDRTLPDVLMLPAIADLYGVTVDELLRGERCNTRERNATISENSLKSINKNRFGCFVSQSSLILGIALTFSAVFVLACILSLWTGAPIWLDLAMLIVGAVGLCVCIAIVTYQYNKAKLSVGAVTNDDLTDEQKVFVTALRRKLENFVLFCALPFAIFALITALVFLFVKPQNGKVFYFTVNVRYGYILVMCLNAAFALALAVSLLIFKTVTVNNYYIEELKTTAKHNRRLVRKLATFSCIPIILVILVNIALLIAFPNSCKTLYKNDYYSSFNHHMQTLDIYTGGGRYGVFLEIPTTKPQNGDTFSGESCVAKYFQRLEAVANPAWDGSIGYWHVRCYGSYFDLNVYECDGKYITNAYYLDENTQDIFGNNYGEMRIVKRNGTYCFVHDISATLTYVAVLTFTIAIVTTSAVCGIIYATKRKKQKYSF